MAGRKVSFISLLACCVSYAGCHHQDKLFSQLPSSQTHIDFSNNLNKNDSVSILNYIYYYNGGGVAVGDINNDGLPDIYFTSNSQGHNKLYLNKGNFEFEDITEKAGVAGTSDWCTGVTMADVNGDGLLDIYVCAVANTHGFKGHNELFINNGNGTFSERAADYGLDFSGYSTQAVFFDYDHDGDLDCFILNQSEHPNQNILDTSFRKVKDRFAGGRLFRNDLNTATKKFTDVSDQAGIYQSRLSYGLGVAVGDFNNDGWDDIYIGNDFHENDYYYLNNGDGSFTESGAHHFGHYSRFSMGNDAADFNNDGQLDLISTDMLPPDEKTLKTYGNGEHLDIYNQKIIKNGYQNQVSRNCLQMNNGDGSSFSDIGLMSGISATDWSWSPFFADFDNDGNKDLFVSTGIVKRPVDLDFVMFFSHFNFKDFEGSKEELVSHALEKMPDGATHPFFFKGNGGLGFKDVSAAWGTAQMRGYYNGAAYADLNNEGKLDVVINCLNAPAVILQNKMPRRNYISIAFEGDGMNKTGIGAKAYIFAGGKMQFQQLMLSRGFMSSSDPRIHFGLDSLTLIDSLLIVWPNQKYQLIRKIPADQQLLVKQQDAELNFDYKLFFPKPKPLFKDVSNQVNCTWKHREDNFIDFNKEYLIPHLESTRGPKLAIADVNRDGLDDIFVCGAKGQPGSLLIQTKDGRFLPSDTAVFARNMECEGVDAVFFDANNDGYPDLYVVSGGNEYEDGDPRLRDHLYINDGKGHFGELGNSIPELLTNKSCISISDVNKDGYPDIFIGGLADAKKYGYASPSYLLLNDGHGKFKLAPESVISLHETGMVTSSAFVDINKDGWPDLIIAGEWMPIRIFINDKGVLKASDIPQSSGLWQSVLVTDVNSDGYPDILAGNWGHNSKLYAGKQGPLKLYVKDFDQNGSIEQILTYTLDGKEYSFLGKDQLEQALPALKKMHLTYSEVAGETVQYMFGDLLTDCTVLKAETLSSSCFLNDRHGGFTRVDLPEDVQLAPIFAFSNSMTTKDGCYFAAGNFYGVLPYEGRYDAMKPLYFSYHPEQAGFAIQEKLTNIDGEVRDIKWINISGGKKLLVIARNNRELVFLKFLGQ
jgi:enediyne biosynthesis protein E4